MEINNNKMFSVEEIAKFTSEVKRLFSLCFDEDMVKMLLAKFNFEHALNHDAELLTSEIDNFLMYQQSEYNKDLLNAIAKGTVIFNYKAKIGEFLSESNKTNSR